jgi:crotonobetainyl-CoA:carnitine CoA-transferase CaiB-like acyl-CoA transferase
LPQAQAIRHLPLLTIERIGDAPPLPLPPITPDERPLAGVRVLDLTRILAGPVCGRALAAYGADVMLINAPHLPNIESIADTSRGKLSAHVDLRTPDGQQALQNLLHGSHVFVQGYRPGALEALHLSPQLVAQQKPGIVCVSLSAYGDVGPWRIRRGFDSLVQTATGFNHAEMLAAGATAPKALPMQILDYATGHLMAFATAAALVKQQQQGGSWHVRVSLAQTALWLRHMGRVNQNAGNGFTVKTPDRRAYLQTWPSGFGELTGFAHSAQLSRTPAVWTRPSMPPGSHPPIWPEPSP